MTVLTDNGTQRKKLIEGLDRPYGLAFWKDYLYVGEPASIKRYKYDRKSMTAGPGEEIVKYPEMGMGHWTRSLLFDAKGEKLYVGVGSRSNVSPGEPEVRAAINRYNPDGSGHEIFAAGTRNPIGLHWQPGTSELWAAVQERDELGDDLVPDYFTRIRQGGFYGWPYAYIGPNEDPRNKGQREDLVKKTIVPDVPLAGPLRGARLRLVHRQDVSGRVSGRGFSGVSRIVEPGQAAGLPGGVCAVQERQAGGQSARVSDGLDAVAGGEGRVGAAGGGAAIAGRQPAGIGRRRNKIWRITYKR